jgi:DNA-binding transcriptional MerR regulator
MDINTLAQLSGIKPHTLRIWEKRYNVINPKRTEGGTRIYSDEDLKTILNIKMLSQYGYKISKAASLTAKERNDIIKEKLKEDTNNNQYSHFINQMIKCAVDLDEINFERYFNQCVIRLGFENTINLIIYPLLKKIGILWEIDNISPLEEHFVSQIIIQKIHEATTLMPYPINSEIAFILFLPQNNHHSIPLLFTNYLLRKKKFKTIYLGEDVPLKNLHKISNKVSADKSIFLTFFIHRQEDNCIKKINNLTKHINPEIDIWIGGETNNLQVIDKTFAQVERIKTFYTVEYLNVMTDKLIKK